MRISSAIHLESAANDGQTGRPILTQLGSRQVFNFAMHHRSARLKADLSSRNIAVSCDRRFDQ